MKITTEEIIKKFNNKHKNKYDYSLVEYEGCFIKVKIICKEHGIFEQKPNNHLNGQNCPQCAAKKRHFSTRYSLQYVKNYFKKQKCELLEANYINNKTKMKYKCSCGNISKINFNDFQQGYKCWECGIKKRSGENHPDWIKDRNKVRIKNELHNLSRPYKKLYRKKYNISKEYDIDHIFPIKAFVDYGIYDIKLINLEENLQPLIPLNNRIFKKAKYNKKEFEKFLIKRNIIK